MKLKSGDILVSCLDWGFELTGVGGFNDFPRLFYIDIIIIDIYY